MTGAVKTDGVLEQTEFDRLKGEIQSLIAGADNAGYIPLLEAGVDFVEMGKSNRDMDFMKLMQSKTHHQLEVETAQVIGLLKIQT